MALAPAGSPIPALARRAASIAWLTVAVLVMSAGTAAATPTAVTVRVEGRSQTLFEGPLLSEGHDVKAAGETEAHPCNGLNEKRYASPGPTPTAATADAMTLIGGSFGGKWEAGFEDFLVKEWAGEREAEGNAWFVSANDTELKVGGCQYELVEGGSVLWSFGAPKPALALYPSSAAEGAPPLVAVATQGVPLALEVLSYKSKEGEPPARPSRAGGAPVANASIVPVQTAAGGAETPLSATPLAQTDESGHASVTFTAPGWQRLKAIASGAVRSNRIDVCVCSPGASSCGALPAEDVPREVGAPVTERPGPSCSGTEASAGTGGSSLGGSAPGRQPAPGGDVAGQRSGATPAAPTLRFAGHALRAHGALWRGLHYRGRWRRLRRSGALEGIVMAGARGGSASFELSAGSPVLALFCAGHSARVELLAGSVHRVFVLHGGRGGPTLIALGRRRAGRVTLRVLAGTPELDGVALGP